jgi:hypothetical protein
MKRQLIVFYTCVILLILAGRYAWLHCEWGWVARVSAIGVIIAILIEGWRILTARSDQDVTLLQGHQTVASARMAIIILCLGIFIAGFGEMLGKAAFGCTTL